MILELHEFIQREGLVSSQQLSREFQLDEEALKPMLDIWIKKGRIQKCLNQISCKSSCSRCKSPPEYYQIV